MKLLEMKKNIDNSIFKIFFKYPSPSIIYKSLMRQRAKKETKFK